MQSDEQAIRELLTTWMAASKAGDTQTVLGLMTDDVVFLVPGQPPMDKRAFAATATAQSGPQRLDIDGQSEIQKLRAYELRDVGHSAYSSRASTQTRFEQQ